MHVPSPNASKPFEKSWALEFVLKTRANSSASQYVASSQRNSPQAISNGFPSVSSVYFVVIPVSLLPTGALPQLFPTVSLPSTLSSLPYRSFPPELSPCYFPRFPLRPPNRCFHPFPPNGALPKLFPTVSPPSTLSSNPYRSLEANVTKREPKHRRCFWE